jgi:small subunit ribosomal protein S20
LANIKASLKDIRVSAARRERNKATKSNLRTSVRKTRTAIAENNNEAAVAALQESISKLDQAAQAGVIHPNAAARKKSRLTKQVNALSK